MADAPRTDAFGSLLAVAGALAAGGGVLAVVFKHRADAPALELTPWVLLAALGVFVAAWGWRRVSAVPDDPQTATVDPVVSESTDAPQLLANSRDAVAPADNRQSPQGLGLAVWILTGVLAVVLLGVMGFGLYQLVPQSNEGSRNQARWQNDPYDEEVSELWRAIHNLELEDQGESVYGVRARIEELHEREAAVQRDAPELYASERFQKLSNAYKVLGVVQAKLNRADREVDKLDDLALRADIETRVFRVSRRFDSTFTMGVYEAKTGLERVVLVVPEEQLPKSRAARLEGMRLNVRDQGEKPIEMRDGHIEYFRRYQWTADDPATEEERKQQRAAVNAADKELESSWLNFRKERTGWPLR